MKSRKSSPARIEKETNGGRRSPRMRQRVAWMYYVEAMTQCDIAEALGIGRITGARLLSEARAMNEVRVTLARDAAIDSSVEIALQKAWGIQEVIVAPRSSKDVDPRAAIAAAAGPYISRLLRPGTKLGLGWGETLNRVLGYIEERPMAELSVVSLLGGIMRVGAANPTEFAWQFARLFGADCYLLAAPAILTAGAAKACEIPSPMPPLARERAMRVSTRRSKHPPSSPPSPKTCSLRPRDAGSPRRQRAR